MEVEEVVMMGRYPHFKINPTKEDIEICNEVIALQDLDAFRKRNFLTLSGGEKQRVNLQEFLRRFGKCHRKVQEYYCWMNRFLLLI